MPRKGMRSLWFSPKPTQSSSSSSSPSPSRLSFPESVMDRTLEVAETMIMKWDPETTTYAKVTSLFYENRREAVEFIKVVNNLQKAMHLLVSESSTSAKLVRGQTLMQIAMKRLQKEFYQILSMNRAHLDPESVSTRSNSVTSTRSSTSDSDEDYDNDEIKPEGKESISEVEDNATVAMNDLKLIAECMINSGYAKECIQIYKIIRKSIVDEGIYRLGVQKFSSSYIHKLDYDVLDMKIKDWLNAVNVAVKTLFNGERILCDHVFSSSDTIRESCFTEISKEGALVLFGFPETVAKHSKKSPEKVFRLLDMYTAISMHWPEIESIFSFDSVLAVKYQAVASLVKIGESVRTALAEFESATQKESSKSPVGGAGVHSLTVHAMSYLCLLADYSGVLSDIIADSAESTETKSLPESFFGFSDSDDSPAPAISLKFAWLILVLLCKLDGKAKHYKDVSFSYLFLANNLQHVVAKVRTSNLKYILGDDWLTKHDAKVKQFAANYERLGWSHVLDVIPKDSTVLMRTDDVKEAFKKFNVLFEQAHRKQSACVVEDNRLRDEIKVSLGRKLVPVYRDFYEVYRKVIMGRERNSGCVVKFAPEDIANRVSDLFFGDVVSGSSSSSTTSSSPNSRQSRLH